MSDMRPDDLSPRRPDADLEHRLQDALEARANEVAPSHRLDTILKEAHAHGSPSNLTRWATALVAAALVVALAIAIPQIFGTDDPTSLDPGATTSSTAPTETETSSPTEEPSETPTEEPSSDATTLPSDEEEGPEESGDLAALPVYLLAHIGDDMRMARLYREWVNVDGVFRDSPLEEQVRAALTTALAGTAPNTDGYLQTWDGVELVDATVSDSRITITLSGPGSSDIDEDEARVSVQQLVWTAQAVVRQGRVPVTFTIADGSTAFFGQIPVNQTFNRPASTDEYFNDLAPIWINSPTRGERINGANVIVTGDATVFEANVQWELINAANGNVIDSGFTTASVGAPGRGTYEIPLGNLAPGSYIIRAFEMSAKDGTTVSAERSIPFTVVAG